MIEELKPCPFCGGEAAESSCAFLGDEIIEVRYRCITDDCPASPRSKTYLNETEAREAAVAAWNRREWNDMRYGRPVITERMMKEMRCPFESWPDGGIDCGC